MNDSSPDTQRPYHEPLPYRPWGMDERAFLLLLHLSVLASMMLPLAGLILPIVMWATNRDRSPAVDEHGKVVLNWIISFVIYSVIAIVLCFTVILLPIGLLMLLALSLVNIVFAIIGGIKANDGILWGYPGTLTFIR